MTTLKNLYYGNIAPHEYEVERGSDIKVVFNVFKDEDLMIYQDLLHG